MTDKISAAAKILRDAKNILIGAGAGLSTAAGYTYSGARFQKYFADFERKYNFHDMYSGGFYPYDSPEEFWAYWSRYIFINRYAQPTSEVHRKLLQLVREKNYFVLTTNVDHLFQLNGFDKARLFYTQGDYGLFQCPTPCHAKTYDNEKIIREMYAAQKNMRVPAELFPRCPVCGEMMTTNLRVDDKFVEDEGWYAASKRYENFLRENLLGDIVYLELGVGANTPGIIKYPFWDFTAENPRAKYICVNYGEALVPKNIADQSIAIDADIKNFLAQI